MVTKAAYKITFWRVCSSRQHDRFLFTYGCTTVGIRIWGQTSKRDSGDNSSIHELYQCSMVYLIQQTLSFGGRERHSNIDRNIKVEVQRKKNSPG